MDSKLIEELNFFTEFKDWYLQIKEDFKFDVKKDNDARDYLSLILLKKNRKWNLNSVINSFKDKILTKNRLLVYGCGPSLEETINFIIKKKGVYFFENFINLAADGASILLREKGIKIDAIFTDLDGITKNEFNYPTFIIIHAHGDNMDNLKFFEDEIISFQNVIGTTQVEPVTNVLNPGGFTDGDRILYFLRTLLSSSQKLFLIGMDFGNIIGKYSKLHIKLDQSASPFKQKKLLYARNLIKWINQKIENEIYYVNSKDIVNGFINLSMEQFLNT
ncbi:MAG: 6-hydroxymethylpterin diphosphokinase MptE-like protein [Candidatus Thorarchaeota archaeon]